MYVCRIKEDLRVQFASLANEFERHLHSLSLELVALAGPLDVSVVTILFTRLSSLTIGVNQDQLSRVKEIQSNLGETVSRCLAQVRQAEQDCIDANVEENDHTVYTTDDLEFEMEEVRKAAARKIAFVENQVSFDFE